MSKKDINDLVKNKIKLICSKIEEVLIGYQKSKTKDNSSLIHKIYSIVPDQKTIDLDKLKKKISSMQKDLEKIYNINKIKKIESDIKAKQNKILQLQKEQSYLAKSIENQKNEIDKDANYSEHNAEINEIKKKIELINKENQNEREIYNSLSIKVKKQVLKIIDLEEKQKIIQKSIDIEEKKKKGESNDKNEQEQVDQIKSLQKIEKNTNSEIIAEQRNYTKIINEQKEKISLLMDQINNANDKLSNLRQKIITEAKIKLYKYEEENRKRNKKKDTKNENRKDFKINLNWKSPTNLKKPEKINFNLRSNPKPFDIKKFNTFNTDKKNMDKNYLSNSTENIITNSHSIDKLKKKELTVVKEEKIEKKIINRAKSPEYIEIEELQNAIKDALKNNIAVHRTENGEIQEVGEFLKKYNKNGKPFDKIKF
jgi:hypothetical protein